MKPAEVPKFSSSNKDEDDEDLFFPLSPLLCLVAGWVFFFFLAVAGCLQLVENSFLIW